MGRLWEYTGAGIFAAGGAGKNGWRWRGLGTRRRMAAGVAGLAVCTLLGVGANAAQAVTDTFKVVFTDNDSMLAGYSNSGSHFTTTLGMKAGTSPSVALLAGGTFEAAFEANNGNLGLSHLGGGTVNTTLGMDAGTSPAIAALPGGGWVVAFQDNDHGLYVYNSSGGKINTGLGMAAGTSPAIAVQPDGSFRVVFTDNDDVLAGYSSTGSHFITTAGLKAGSSPAVAAEPDGSYEAAAQASTGGLATFHIGSGVSVNTTTLGMAAGTSPAIAVQPDGSFRVVFTDNDDVLAGYSSTGSHFITTAGLKAGTSPSVTTEPDGSYEAAAQASTGGLATFHIGSGVSVNTTTLGMDPGTSPSLAIPTPAPTPATGCGKANNCTPQTFADAILGYPGINGVITASNEYALETWERAEGGGAGCPGQPAHTAPWAYSGGPAGNPINTTQQEPGSTAWNSVGVQVYQNYEGVTCWEWGIKANADTLLNGFYSNILSTLDHPVSSNYSQCVDLADAVGNSPWGTGNFSADC